MSLQEEKKKFQNISKWRVGMILDEGIRQDFETFIIQSHIRLMEEMCERLREKIDYHSPIYGEYNQAFVTALEEEIEYYKDTITNLNKELKAN